MQCVLNNGVISIDVRTVSCFVRKVVYKAQKKKTGPRCDPWGTPAVTECFAEGMGFQLSSFMYAIPGSMYVHTSTRF